MKEGELQLLLHGQVGPHTVKSRVRMPAGMVPLLQGFLGLFMGVLAFGLVPSLSVKAGVMSLL